MPEGNNIDHLQIEVSSNARDAAYGINLLAKSLDGLKSSSESVKKLASSTEKLNETTKQVNSQSASAGYKGLLSVIKSLSGPVNKAASAFKKLIKNISSNVFAALTSKLRGIINGVQRLYHSIQRVVLMRAIRAALRQITAGFKEGIDNLYQWSAAVDGRFKGSMDKLATSMLYLKNSIAAMVAPIINKLAPAIDYLVDRFVDLLNIVNQVFAALTGNNTWTRAVKYPVEYAESVADAAKDTADGYKEAAKELKLFLLPFDELNVLTKDNPAADSSPGGKTGGAGGGGLNYAEMFETRELEDWAKKIKDLIDQGDWYGAGQALADHLNKLIEQWDAHEFGTKVAEKLNEGVRFGLGFMRRFGWEELGGKFGGLLNGFAETFSWEEFGALLGTKVNAVSGFLKGFFKQFNGSTFGKGLGQLFNGWVKEIKVKDITDAFELGVEDATQIIISFFETVDYDLLAQQIADLLTGCDWENIMSQVWEVAKAAIGATWKLGSALVDNLWNGYETDENGNKVSNPQKAKYGKGIVIGGAALGVGAAGLAGLSGIMGLITKLAPVFKLFSGGTTTSILSKLFSTAGIKTGAEAAGTGALSGAAGTATIAAGGTLAYAMALLGLNKLGKKLGTAGIEQLSNGDKTFGLSNLLASLGISTGQWGIGGLQGGLMGGAMGGAAGYSLGALALAIEKIKDHLKGAKDEADNANISIDDLFSTIFGNADPASDALSDIATEESKTGTAAKQAADDIQKSFKGLPAWFFDLWEGIKKPFVDAWNYIKREFNDKIDQIKRDFNDFKDYIDTNFKQPIEAIFGNLGQAIIYLVEGDFGKAVASAQRAINALITVAENVINMIVGGFNNSFIAPANAKLAEWGIDYQMGYIPEVSLGRIQNIAANDEFMDKTAPALSKGIAGNESSAYSSLRDSVFGGNGGNSTNTVNVTVELDGEKVGQSTVNYVNEQTWANGRSPLLAY